MKPPFEPDPTHTSATRAPQTGAEDIHCFGELDDCARCGASLIDAMLGGVGCDASGPTNPSGYFGFALTPTEQNAGITIIDKAAWLSRGSAAGVLDDGYLERRAAWDAAVLSDVAGLAADARRLAERRSTLVRAR